MKKFLALALAVICIFSMATVAFAGLEYGYVCDNCGGTSASPAALQEHIKANDCGKCAYCAQGFETSALLADHEYVCRHANKGCDYCGGTFASNADYDAHIEACKAKYFNIPVAKIVATIKDLFSKIDWSSVLGTVKDLGGKLGGLLGNIGK